MENSLIERLRTRKGFTLIELLIVIVIIGILAVGLVPKVIDAPKKARDTVRKKDLDSIKVAMESYYADTTKYPACAGGNACAVDSLASFASYFQGGVIPKDPSQKNPDGSALSYTYTPFTGCYVLIAKLESTTGGNANNGTSANSCSMVSGLTPGSGAYQYVAGGSF